ncbi:hypothetical protein EDB80DRAFT_594513, partial [Ilyonectria destructans]
ITKLHINADLDRLKLPEADKGAYDVVFSWLALQYRVQFPELVREVHRMLKPGAPFVFSIEHPIFTAPSRPGFITD